MTTADTSPRPGSTPEFVRGSVAAQTPEPEIVTWLRQQSWSDFAMSLVVQFDQTGRLSDRQTAAAQSMRAKTQARRSAPIAPTAPAPIDLSEVPAGCYAVPGGTRLKVRIDKPEDGPWAGWVFVKDGAVYGAGKSYGSQRPGQPYRGQIEDALRAIVGDPRAAMAEYGRITSTCGLCGRPLEDKESVERGIGPTCAKKRGWL